MKTNLTLNFWLPLFNDFNSQFFFFSAISYFCDYLIKQTIHTSKVLFQFPPMTFPKLVYLQRHNVTKARFPAWGGDSGSSRRLVPSKLSRPLRFNYPAQLTVGDGEGVGGGVTEAAELTSPLPPPTPPREPAVNPVYQGQRGGKADGRDFCIQLAT